MHELAHTITDVDDASTLPTEMIGLWRCPAAAPRACQELAYGLVLHTNSLVSAPRSNHGRGCRLGGPASTQAHGPVHMADTEVGTINHSQMKWPK